MTATLSLSESTAACQAITRGAKSNFLVPFRTLSPEKRVAFEVVYAFMRLTDDISDEPEGTGRAARFREWRSGLHRAFDGDASHDAVFPALVHIAREYEIPPALFDELIDGTEQDLVVTRFETFDELRSYCYKVASVVGLVSLHIFELRNPTDENQKLSQEMAVDCGLAFQITNILRDVTEDLDRDRIYIPQEDLRRFGVTEADLRSRIVSAQFQQLMQHQWDRAENLYLRSRSLASMLTKPAQACLCSMRAIYYRLHTKIKRRRFDVFRSRVRVTGIEKFALAIRSLLLRRGP